MALKVWTISSCPLQAISDLGATGALWEISSAGSPRFLYRGEALAEAPLAVYYGDTLLTKVTSLSDLSSTNTWLWGNYEGDEDVATIYVNTGESVETAQSDIVYMSQKLTVIAADLEIDRICIGARISNNADVAADIRFTLYDSANNYKAHVLPVITLEANTLVDDNSKLAVPVGYKLCIEASTPEVSVLVSGDEY